MKNKLLILFLFIFMVSQAQESNYSYSFPQKFTQKVSDEFISEVYNITNKDSFEFATISAYCLNNLVQSAFYYRVHANNTWQPWKELSEDKEGNNTERKVYGLVTIFDKFSKIQFKSSLEVRDEITFRMFFSTNEEEIEFNTYKEISGCDLPTNCDRGCWCPSGNCDPQSSPYYIDVTHVIVHHSATNYSSGTDYAQVVYSYWDYHVNTHGWNDIGYNWLVDPNGVLYEGRGDGVQGAHFSCMNGNTMGVCMIGNFETATPTTQAITTLENLIAWEATDKDIDVLATKYHPPSQLNLYTVSGHNDGNSSPVGCPSGTLCPGTNLYSELATIRTDVSGFPCYVTASIADITTDNVSVYPNPVIDQLTITTNTNSLINNKISIYNTLGIKVKTVKLTSNKIDLSKLNSGIYFVHFIEMETPKIIKVVKR